MPVREVPQRPGVADLLLPVLPGEDIPTGDAEGRAGQD